MMGKRTLQEWADFTGWFVAMHKPNNNAFISRRYTLFENRPDCIDIDDQGGMWVQKSGWTMDIPLQLIIPFSGDWKESLHTPKE